jgi:prepilin-type N-terminal cleavage/methylation domain-containing protein
MPGLTTDGRRGVTLVELLIVMVILSLALTLVIPTMTNTYDNWTLRSAGRRTLAFLRFASDVARRDGTEIAGYYADQRLVLVREGTVFKELEIPATVTVQPEKPSGVVFLSTGQIIAPQPFVLKNQRGRSVVLSVGPLPGQIGWKEEMQ